MKTGRVLKHESLGIVTETGSAVDRVKVERWVCVPFIIGCGFCRKTRFEPSGANIYPHRGIPAAGSGSGRLVQGAADRCGLRLGKDEFTLAG